ncbi:MULTISPECIES: hypothetical protein [Pseudoalteromonas]|nr:MULTISPECIES: hypothetical protein [Pseudoalteromonas]|tara:strand:+ start:2868 stop:3014 length:147 start_codon:yes stop_codon:yes gene_type:complete
MMSKTPSHGGSYTKDAKGELTLVARTQPVATVKKPVTKPVKAKGKDND